MPPFFTSESVLNSQLPSCTSCPLYCCLYCLFSRFVTCCPNITLYCPVTSSPYCHTAISFTQSLQPKAHRSSIVQPATPAIPIRLLALLRSTSLTFHWVEKFKDSHIRLFSSKECLIFLGAAGFKVMAGISFNSLRHARKLTSVETRIASTIA